MVLGLNNLLHQFGSSVVSLKTRLCFYPEQGRGWKESSLKEGRRGGFCASIG